MASRSGISAGKPAGGLPVSSSHFSSVGMSLDWIKAVGGANLQLRSKIGMSVTT